MLQLATQLHCCVASWKVLLHVLPSPQTLSRNKISLLQVQAACCSKLNWRLIFSTNFFNLQQQNFVAWQCLRWVVIRATTFFNLQRNNVALQFEEKCFPYYLAFKTYKMTGSKWAIELIDCWTRRTLYYMFYRRVKMCIALRTKSTTTTRIEMTLKNF